MKSKAVLVLCAGTTLALLSGCASSPPQFVPAPCPATPTAPAVLMQPLPTLDLLPPEAQGSGRNPTNRSRSDAR